MQKAKAWVAACNSHSSDGKRRRMGKYFYTTVSCFEKSMDKGYFPVGLDMPMAEYQWLLRAFQGRDSKLLYEQCRIWQICSATFSSEEGQGREEEKSRHTRSQPTHFSHPQKDAACLHLQALPWLQLLRCCQIMLRSFQAEGELSLQKRCLTLIKTTSSGCWLDNWAHIRTWSQLPTRQPGLLSLFQSWKTPSSPSSLS